MRVEFARVLASALALAAASTPAWPRPYTVEDLLRAESFGQISVDPTDRRLVIERLRPRAAAGAFDHDYFNRHLRSELFVVDLDRPGPARRLLPPEEGIGHVLGPWSPTGDRLVIYRLRDRRWTVGLVELKQGGIRWLDLSPEHPGWGRTVQWRSDGALVMIVTADGDPPSAMRPWAGTDRLTELSSTARQGRRSTRTIVGAGAFQDRSPAPPTNRLVVVDAATGRTRALAWGRFHDLELSSSGRFAAVLDFNEPVRVDPDAPFIAGEQPYRQGVRIVDLEGSGVWSPLGDRHVLPNLLAWSPVGDELLVWSRSGRETWAAGRLARLDPAARTAAEVEAGGFTATLLETPGLRIPVIAADWLGADPVLYATSPGGRRDWIRTGPNARPLTAALARVPERLAARGTDRLWLLSDRGLWRVQAAGATRLTPPEAVVSAAPAALVDLGQRFAFNNPPQSAGPPTVITAEGDRFPAHPSPGPPSSPGRAPSSAGVPTGRARLVAARTTVLQRVDDRFRQSLWAARAGSAPVEVARVNDHYADIAFAPRRPVRHRGPSGEELTSWLYLPSPDAPSRRDGPPPLIVAPYPGVVNMTPPPSADATSPSVMISVPVLTGAGFAVLLPSLPRAAQTGEPAADLASQTLAVVDAAGRDGGFDPQRMALWGHSFGAFAAVAIASQTDRFKAVVGAGGVYDLVAAWGEFSPQARILPEAGLSIRSRAGWVETGQPGMAGPPWAETGRYTRNSPLMGAARISAPVLLIASDRDYIPLSQAESLFSALYRQNKDAVLLTFFGEGHVFESPANLREMASYVLDWLREVLVRRSEPVSAPTETDSRSKPSSSSPDPPEA